MSIVPISQGVAGGSARAENERRVKGRDGRVNKRFSRAGKYILALTVERKAGGHGRQARKQNPLLENF